MRPASADPHGPPCRGNLATRSNWIGCRKRRRASFSVEVTSCKLETGMAGAIDRTRAHVDARGWARRSTRSCSQMRIARRYVISGLVQGVGFRFFTEAAAAREGLHGWVQNLADGRVEITA